MKLLQRNFLANTKISNIHILIIFEINVLLKQIYIVGLPPLLGKHNYSLYEAFRYSVSFTYKLVPSCDHK